MIVRRPPLVKFTPSNRNVTFASGSASTKQVKVTLSSSGTLVSLGDISTLGAAVCVYSMISIALPHHFFDYIQSVDLIRQKYNLYIYYVMPEYRGVALGNSAVSGNCTPTLGSPPHRLNRNV